MRRAAVLLLAVGLLAGCPDTESRPNISILAAHRNFCGIAEELTQRSHTGEFSDDLEEAAELYEAADDSEFAERVRVFAEDPQTAEIEWDVSVYLTTTPDPAEVARIESEIVATDGVARVVFVTEREAIEEFSATYPEFAKALAVGDLPGSYRLSLTGTEAALRAFRSRMTDFSSVDEVQIGPPEYSLGGDPVLMAHCRPYFPPQ